MAPVTYWGAHKERERDYCAPDPANVTDPENACCKAPEGTAASLELGTELQTLEIEAGWYRHTEYSAEVMPCRYAFECKGWSAGNLTTIAIDTTGDNHSETTNTSTAIALPVPAGEDLCAEGYTGPMCR